MVVVWGQQVFSKIINKKPIIHTRILSIDGGGVRGIVPAITLTYLEEKLQQLSGNTGARLADYFDLLAGTSTGGLIVASLLTPDKNNRPKYSAAEIVDLYLKNAEAIFQSSFIQGIKSASGLLDVKYNTAGVNSVYQQYFADTELKQLLKPCLIPVYDLATGKNYFFRQRAAKAGYKHNYYVKDMLRAATAALTYFPPAKINNINNTRECCFIDGGIFAINPALSAYAEFRHLNKKLLSEDTLILSLGTGKQTTLLNCEEIRHWGAVEWRDPGSHLIATALASQSNYELTAVYCDNNNYLRLNPIIDNQHNAKLDNSDSVYLEFLCELGRQSIRDNQVALDSFAERLVESGVR
ncbi:Patatin-like protein [uncultured Candidatus Thioglobus sp.]|nr:Patatin-like protein [uncultured Candidatus Thioglobus sp.]SMN02174.1 Patatin-like protein [uncultured Candidatus Thioglobus sp.]